MLNPSTLEDRLANIGDYEIEADAAMEWGDILKSYLGDADIAQAPMTPVALNAGAAALSPALVGMSQAGMGATKLQQGLVAFWTAVVASYATTAIVVTPPPGITGLTPQLEATFASVTASSLERSDAASLLSGIMHTANQGGAWVTPAGAAGPIL